MDEYLICPKCKQSSTVDFWDRHTKAECGIKEGDHYISAGASKKDHDEVQSYYKCPICNEEIAGIDLISK